MILYTPCVIPKSNNGNLKMHIKQKKYKNLQIHNIQIMNNLLIIYIHVVGPCHHGMARPQVADRGTASDKEGSCEYIE